MYKYSNGQISLADFRQPVGMQLKEDNRWVKKAQTIPWLEIEKRYAALFSNRKGNVANPLRLALGACIISKRNEDRLAAIRTLYEQQKYLYDNRCHTFPDRIVSVNQPFRRPIVRERRESP